MAIRFTVMMHNVLALVLAGVPASANAQNTHVGMAGDPKIPIALEHAWETAYRSGLDLRLKGNYSDALSSIKQSVAIARADNDPRELATSLNMLGVLYSFEGELSDAEQTLTEAIDLQSKFGSNSSLFMSSLGNLALVYQDQSRYELAESLLPRQLPRGCTALEEKQGGLRLVPGKFLGGFTKATAHSTIKAKGKLGLIKLKLG